MNAPSGPEVSVVDPVSDPGATAENRGAHSAWGSAAKFVARNPHALLTPLLIVALIPALASVHQPLAYRWQKLFAAYWVSLAFQSIFAAAVFGAIALPAEVTWRPLVRRYALEKRRLLLLIPIVALLSLLFARLVSVLIVPVVLVVVLALLEFFERKLSQANSLREALAGALVPALYLFIGLLLVFAYNDVAMAARPFVSYDSWLQRADSALFLGTSPAGVAHRLAMRLPPAAIGLTESIYYYCMFPQVGGALILIALAQGTRSALRFVGTILTAYYLAVAVFWVWPTLGPFSSGQGDASFSVGPLTHMVQTQVMAQVQSLWNARPLPAIGLDYYIAFPSLHIALPMITAWFLRPWPRIVKCLLVFDLLLVASIFLLQWHYVVDLPAGAVLAAVTILISWRSVRAAGDLRRAMT